MAGSEIVPIGAVERETTERVVRGWAITAIAVRSVLGPQVILSVHDPRAVIGDDES